MCSLVTQSFSLEVCVHLLVMLHNLSHWRNLFIWRYVTHSPSRGMCSLVTQSVSLEVCPLMLNSLSPCTESVSLEVHVYLLNSLPLCRYNNENNYRGFIERFLRLKALYNLKKNRHCTNTHIQLYKWYINKQTKCPKTKHIHTKHGENMHTQDRAHTYDTHTLNLNGSTCSCLTK